MVKVWDAAFSPEKVWEKVWDAEKRHRTIQRSASMEKKRGGVLLLILLMLSMTGCTGIGDKDANISTVYCATAALSLLAVAGYCFTIRKKDRWFLILFSSVFVVNAGYMALSLSQTLEGALWANRLSYLGSVFLPMSMLMIILRTCGFRYSKYLPRVLTTIGIGVFMIAASPGWLDIYYKEVSLSSFRGMTVLEKVYGPWHSVYLFYLLGYFGATAGAIFHTCANNKEDSAIHVVFLGAAVFINMGVWLLEQLVRIDFELLSVSYIVSELFLLMLCLIIQEEDKRKQKAAVFPQEAPVGETIIEPAAEDIPDTPPSQAGIYEDRYTYFAAQRSKLTPAERTIYGFYLDGKSTREIMAELNIKENTLKYHNKNIYGKLGVSSRKELVEIASHLPVSPETDAAHK